MRSLIHAVVFLAVALLAAMLTVSPLSAQQDPCKTWKKSIKADEGYHAKLRFRGIDVTHDGEIVGENPRHAKEIREGEEVRFGDIECEKVSVDIEVISVSRGVKTRLRLLISKDERTSTGPARLDEMLAVVIEKR